MATKKGASHISMLSNKEEFNLLIDAQGTNWLHPEVTLTMLFEKTALHVIYFQVQCINCGTR